MLTAEAAGRQLPARGRRVGFLLMTAALLSLSVAILVPVGAPQNGTMPDALRDALDNLPLPPDWGTAFGLARLGTLFVAAGYVGGVIMFVFPPFHRAITLAAGLGVLGLTILAGDVVGAHVRPCPWPTVAPIVVIMLACGFGCLVSGSRLTVSTGWRSQLVLPLAPIAGTAGAVHLGIVIASAQCPILT